MSDKDFQKDLDSIWLTLRLNAMHDEYDECFLSKKLKKFKTQLHFRIRRYDDNGEFIGFEGYWQIFDVLVFLREDAKYNCCDPLRKSGTKIFQLTNDQAMDEGELIWLENTIDKMLNGKIQSEYLWFMEPIFNFTLDKRDGKPFMKMNLEHGNLNIFFNARDMRLFSLYLKLKRGAISLDDEEIKSMFNRGILYRKKFLGGKTYGE